MGTGRRASPALPRPLVDLGLAFIAEGWDEELVRTELAIGGQGIGERLLDGGSIVGATTDTGQTWSSGDPATATRIEGLARTVLEWLTGRHPDGYPTLGPWSW